MSGNDYLIFGFGLAVPAALLINIVTFTILLPMTVAGCVGVVLIIIGVIKKRKRKGN